MEWRKVYLKIGKAIVFPMNYFVSSNNIGVLIKGGQRISRIKAIEMIEDTVKKGEKLLEEEKEEIINKSFFSFTCLKEFEKRKKELEELMSKYEENVKVVQERKDVLKLLYVSEEKEVLFITSINDINREDSNE